MYNSLNKGAVLITELIRFNCHILDIKKHSDSITPEKLLEQYNKSNIDLIFDDTLVEIDTITWASGRTSILTKVKRKDK